MWPNLAGDMREARENNDLATDDPHHLIVHELGELALQQSVGVERGDPMTPEYEADENAFRALDEPPADLEEGEVPPASPLDIIGDVVSSLAQENHGEFVAEVFAALVLGREDVRENEVVMDLYRRFGGDRILEWSRRLP